MFAATNTIIPANLHQVTQGEFSHSNILPNWITNKYEIYIELFNYTMSDILHPRRVFSEITLVKLLIILGKMSAYEKADPRVAGSRGMDVFPLSYLGWLEKSSWSHHQSLVKVYFRNTSSSLLLNMPSSFLPWTFPRAVRSAEPAPLACPTVAFSSSRVSGRLPTEAWVVLPPASIHPCLAKEGSCFLLEFHSYPTFKLAD